MRCTKEEEMKGFDKDFLWGGVTAAKQYDDTV